MQLNPITGKFDIVGLTQTQADSIYSQPGLIIRVTNDGANVSYVPSSDTDAARGAALLSAVSAMSAYDTIMVGGPANYTISSSITPQANTSIFGVGRPTITATGLSNPNIILSNSNVTLEGFDVVSDLTCIGLHSATPTTATGLILRDLYLSVSDTSGSGVMFSTTSAGGTTQHTIGLKAYHVRSIGGTVSGFGFYAQLSATGRIELWNCDSYGATDGTLFNQDGDSFIYGGSSRSALDAYTSGNSHVMTLVGCYARGDQSDIYSDDGTVYVSYCDTRSEYTVGNNIQFQDNVIVGNLIPTSDGSTSSSLGTPSIPWHQIIGDTLIAYRGGVQSYIYAYNTALTKYLQFFNNGTYGIINANSDIIIGASAPSSYNIIFQNIMAQANVATTGTTPASIWFSQSSTSALGSGAHSMIQQDIDKDQTSWLTTNGLFQDITADFALGTHINQAATSNKSTGLVLGIHGTNLVGQFNAIDSTNSWVERTFVYGTGSNNLFEVNINRSFSATDPSASGSSSGTSYTGHVWSLKDNGTEKFYVDYRGAVSSIHLPKVTSTTSTSTLTFSWDTDELSILTAMAANVTIASPSGTPVDGQLINFRFKDNGTSRTITWNAIFRAIGITLPTATTISKTLYVSGRYNSADTKVDMLAVGLEA